MQNILSKGKGEKLSKKKSKTEQININSAIHFLFIIYQQTAAARPINKQNADKLEDPSMAATSQTFKHQLSIFFNSQK